MTSHRFVLFTICLSVLTPLTALRGEEAAAGKEQVSEAAKSSLKLVNEYLATEMMSGDERVERRREMIKFSFRTTSESGRDRVMSEKAWEDWETERFANRVVSRTKVIGEPIVEKRSKNIYRVSMAVHVNESQKGRPWTGVSYRQYEVRLNSNAAQIVHERTSVAREGIELGGWTEVAKKETGSSRSNVRSSPTTSFNNVIAKVENGERVRVWDQKGQGWLLVRTVRDEVGFIHRSQLDFSVQVAGTTKGATLGRDRSGRRYFPYALMIPGRSGFVLNPYTQSIVDVRGMRAGTLVRDPGDSEASEKFFRVPFTTVPARAVIVEAEVASTE